jgi:hypothetical protein
MRSAKSRRIITIVVGFVAVAVVAFLAVGLIFEDSVPGQMLQGAAVQSGGNQPAYGEGITVDGNPSDWDLQADYFADMYRAAKPSKPVESTLYLRYDCGQGVMYVLVLAVDGVPALVQPADAYVKIAEFGNSTIVDGNSGSDGTAPDFSWVDQGYDGDSNHARGWEGSFSIAQGDYTINAHVQVLDDGAAQTSAVVNRALGFTLRCTTPTAVVLTDFTAAWANSDRSASTERGAAGIVLRWETASELDNLGFNVYRASKKNGPWTMLNMQLIPSLVPPGSPIGASYEWTDAGAKQGQKYFYMLEDVDLHGTATKHGPVAP